MDAFTTRPVIHCLIVLTGVIVRDRPICFQIIDLLELPRWQQMGFEFVGVDPLDEDAFMAWKQEHEADE